MQTGQPPKRSNTAPVGRDVFSPNPSPLRSGSGDERVREAHHAASRALWTSWSGIPSAHRRQQSGRDDRQIHRRKFEHDTARPVDGYAAPQLHTHAVIFNVTERENGSTVPCRSAPFRESTVMRQPFISLS